MIAVFGDIDALKHSQTLHCIKKMEDRQRSELLRSSKYDPWSASITDFTPSLSTQTLWAFLTDSTQALVPPPPASRLYVLSPPAAVYLIHDPTIIRQSPVGPFLAQGDTHGATKYIIFKEIFVNGGSVGQIFSPYFTKKCDMQCVW